MSKAHQPKETQVHRHIVFENFLRRWFDELYPPNDKQSFSHPNERVAELLYDGRPRLSAIEVAEIIRSKSKVPEPWLNRPACMGAGTIVLRAPSSIQPAREAFGELRRALARIVSEAQAERRQEDHQTLLSAIGESGLRNRNMNLIKEVTQIINDFDSSPRFLVLRARSSPPWHIEAALLYDKFLEIVGHPIVNAKGGRAAALRFVQAMLDRLAGC
jgi:hypothetical protein